MTDAEKEAAVDKFIAALQREREASMRSLRQSFQNVLDGMPRKLQADRLAELPVSETKH